MVSVIKVGDKWVEGICIDCGRITDPFSTMTCPCGGWVILVHNEDEHEVKKQVAILQSSPAARRKAKIKKDIPT
jgi:hypothetical protein